MGFLQITLIKSLAWLAVMAMGSYAMDMKGCICRFASGRYTLSYPRGRILLNIWRCPATGDSRNYVKNEPAWGSATTLMRVGHDDSFLSTGA